MERDSGGRRSREKKSSLPKHSGKTGRRQSPSGDPCDYSQHGQKLVQQELSPVTGSEDGEYDAPWDLAQRNAYTRLGLAIPSAAMPQDNLPQDQNVYGTTSTQKPQGQPREGLTLTSFPQGQATHGLFNSQRHHWSLEKMEEIHSQHYHPHMEMSAIPSPIESPLYQEIPYDFDGKQQESNADPDSIYYHKYGIVERKELLTKFQEQPPPLPPKGISRLGFEKEEPPHIYEKVGSTSESCSPSPTTPTGHAYVEIFVTEQNYEVLSKSHETTGIYTYKKGMHFASPSCGIRMAEIRASKRGNDYQKTPYARLQEDGSEASPTGSLSRSVSTGSRTSLSPPVSPNIKTNTSSRKNQLPGHPEEGTVTSPSLRQNVLEFQFKEKAFGVSVTDHVFTSLFDGNKVSASTQHQTDHFQGQTSEKSPLAYAEEATNAQDSRMIQQNTVKELVLPGGSTDYIPQDESLTSPLFVPNSNQSNKMMPQSGIPKSAKDKPKPQKSKPQTKDAASQFGSHQLQKTLTQYTRKDLIKIKKKERSESSESDKTMTSGSSDKHSTSSLLKLASKPANGSTTQRKEMRRESDELQQLDKKEVSMETNVNIGLPKQQSAISKLPQVGAFKKSTKRVTQTKQTSSLGQDLKPGSQPQQTDQNKQEIAYRHRKQTTSNQSSPRKIGQGLKSDLRSSNSSHLKSFPFESKLMDYSDSSTDSSSDSEHSGWCHGNQETDDNDIPQSSIPSSLTSSCSSVTSDPEVSMQLQQKYDFGKLSLPYQRQRSCPVDAGSRGQLLPRKSSLPQAGSLSKNTHPIEHIRSSSTSQVDFQVDCYPASQSKSFHQREVSTNSGITNPYATQRNDITLPHSASKHGTLSPSTGNDKQRHVSSSSGYSTTSSPDPSIQPSRSHDPLRSRVPDPSIQPSRSHDPQRSRVPDPSIQPSKSLDPQRSRIQPPEQSPKLQDPSTPKSRLQPSSGMTSRLQPHVSLKSSEISTQTDHSMRHGPSKQAGTTPKLSQVDENVSSPSPSPRTRGGLHFVFPDSERRPKPFKLRPAQKASFRPARSPLKINKATKDFKFSTESLKTEMLQKSEQMQSETEATESPKNRNIGKMQSNSDLGVGQTPNLEMIEDEEPKPVSPTKLKPPSRLQNPQIAPIKLAKVLRSEEYVKAKGDNVETDPFRHTKDMRLTKEIKTRQWILDQQERVADITKNKPSQPDNSDKLTLVKDQEACIKEELNAKRHEAGSTSQNQSTTKTTSPLSPVLDPQISPSRDISKNRQWPLRFPTSSLERHSQISNASSCTGWDIKGTPSQGTPSQLQRQMSSPLERSLRSSREGSPFYASREVTPSRSLSSSSTRGVTPDRVSNNTDISSKTSLSSRVPKRNAPPVPPRGSSLKSPTSPSDVAIVTQMPRSESENTYLCGPVTVRERTLKFEQKTIDSLPRSSKRFSDPETLRHQSAILPKTKSHDSKISKLQKLLFDAKENTGRPLESKSSDNIQEEKCSDESISPTDIEMLSSRGMLARGKRENSKQRETPPRNVGHTEDLSLDLKTHQAMKLKPTVSRRSKSPEKTTRNESLSLSCLGNTGDISSLRDICLTPNKAELEPKKTEIFKKRSESKPLESYKHSEENEEIGDLQCNEEQIKQDTTDYGQTGRQHKTVKTNIQCTHERLEKSEEPVEIDEPVSPGTPEDKGEPVSPTTSYTLCYGCDSEADMTPEPEVKSFEPQPSSRGSSLISTCKKPMDSFLSSAFPDLDNEFPSDCHNSIAIDTALDTHLLSQFSVSSPVELGNPCNDATRSVEISQGLKGSHSPNTGNISVSVTQRLETITGDKNSETPMDSHIAIATKTAMLSSDQGECLENEVLVSRQSSENTKETVSVMNLGQERSCKIWGSGATSRINETEIRASSCKDTHLITENNIDKSQNNTLDTENGANSSIHDSDMLTSVEKQPRNERNSEISAEILTEIEINDTTHKSDIKQSYSPAGTTSQCEIKNAETPKIPVILSQLDIPHDKGTSQDHLQHEQNVREINASLSHNVETLSLYDEIDGKKECSQTQVCGLLEKKIETTPNALSDSEGSQSLENQQSKEMLSIKTLSASVKAGVMLLNQHSKLEIVCQNVVYTTLGNSADEPETAKKKSTSHVSNHYGMEPVKQNTIELKHDLSTLSAAHSHEGSSHCFEQAGNRGEKGKGRGDCVHGQSDKTAKCDFYDENLDKKDEKLQIHKNKDIESLRCKFENVSSAKSSHLSVQEREKGLVIEKQLWKKEEESKIVFTKTQSEETLKADSASGSKELLGSKDSTGVRSETGLEPEAFNHGTPSLIAAKSDSMSDSGISFSAETDSASQSRTSLITRGESNHSNISGDTIGSNEASPKSSPKHRKFSQSDSPKSQLPLQAGFRKMSDPCKPRVQLSPRLHQTSPKHSKKQVHRPATIAKNVNEGDDPGYGTWDVTTCKEKGQILFYISHEYEDMYEESLEERGGVKRKPSLQNPLKRLSEHVKPPNLSPSLLRQESPTRAHSSPDLEDKPQQKDLKSPKFNMGLSSFITDENTLKRSEPNTALNVPSGDADGNSEDLSLGLLIKETSVSESSLHTASSVHIDQAGVNSPDGSLNRRQHSAKDEEVISRRSVSPISPCTSPLPVQGHTRVSPDRSPFNSPLKSPLLRSPVKSPTKDSIKKGQANSPGRLPKSGIKTPASFSRKSASPSPKHESRAVAIETDQACMEVRPKEMSPNSKKTIPKFSFQKKKSPEKEVILSEKQKTNKFVAEILKRQKSPPKSSTLSQRLGGDQTSGSTRNLSRKVSPQDSVPSGHFAVKATGTRVPNPSKTPKDGGLKKPGFATKLPSFRAAPKMDTKAGPTSPDATEKSSKSTNEPKGRSLPRSKLRLPKQRSADSDKTEAKPNSASNRGSV